MADVCVCVYVYDVLVVSGWVGPDDRRRCIVFSVSCQWRVLDADDTNKQQQKQTGRKRITHTSYMLYDKQSVHLSPSSFLIPFSLLYPIPFMLFV